MTENFGALIRAAREKRGWSQEFLAAKVGATQSTIDRIETGATRRSRVLPEIAGLLDLDIPGMVRPAADKQTVPNFVRVSYVLPVEIAKRIEKYKIELGVSSDDEAAKRLIGDALNRRDTFREVIQRLIDRYKLTRSMREAAGDVIANHPLVVSMSFTDEGVKFTMSNGFSVIASPPGKAIINKPSGDFYKYHADDAPDWADWMNRTKEWAEADEMDF